jgi:hypothetical protein
MTMTENAGDGQGQGGGANAGSDSGGGSGPGGAGNDGGGGAGGPAPGATVNEERIVDRAVGKIKEWLGPLLPQVEDPGAGGEGGGDAGGEGGAPTPPHVVEDNLEAQVREAMGRVRAEEDHEHDHEVLRTLAEARPVRQSRSFDFLFGGGKK